MELFYPERDDGMDEPEKKRRRRQSQRRKGFLRGLGDADYDAVFRRIVHNGSHTGTRQSFPDVEGFLKTKKDEGQIMRRVMEHVVRWVNGSPYEVVDNRDNNKPLLREDLKPALRLRKTLDNRNGREIACASEETAEEQAEVDSIILERRVLDIVRSGMDSFKSPAALASLDVLPAVDRDGYAERFAEEPWKEVLRSVQEMFGPDFKPPWKGPGTVVVGSGDEGQKKPISAITRSLAALAGGIPEISSNLALNSRDALRELCEALDKGVAEWVVRRCGTMLEVLEERARNGGQARPDDAVQVIKTAGQTYQSHLERYGSGVDHGDHSAVAASSASPVPPPSLSPSSPSPPLSTEPNRSAGKAARGNGQAQHATATLTSQSQGKLLSEGPLSTRKQDGNGSRQVRVENAPRRPPPLPLTRSTRSTPVTADVNARSAGKPRLQTSSQKRSHKKPRLRVNDTLPSIADMLANLNGTNTHGRVTQAARRWDGPVAR